MDNLQSAIRNRIDHMSWGLGLAVTAVSVWVWLADLNRLTIYSFFPLLGLLAFSLMWTHYILHALRVYSKIDTPANPLYGAVTGKIVLISLLLHPGLLMIKLYADGNGLPPKSYSSYVGSAMVGFVALGAVAWLAFMMYELRSRYSQKNWWKYVTIFNALAMIFIVIHSLKLGRHLQTGFLRDVWYFYAVSLLGSYAYLISKKKFF